MLWILACSGAPGDTATSSGIVGDEDATWMGDVEAETPPQLDAEGVAAGVEAALAQLDGLHAGPLIDAYDQLAADMTEDCPTFYDDDGFVYWYDSCVTEDGAQFEGYAGVFTYEDFESDGYVYDGDQLLAAATVVTTEGHTFSGSGYAQKLIATPAAEDGWLIYYSYLDEGFAWDGDGAEGTWLADGLDPGLGYYRFTADDVTMQVYIDGSLSLPAGGAIEAIAFDEVLVGNEAAGVSCPDELAGTLSVLDPEGRWIDVVFDAPADLWSEATCDGCGTAWYRGDALGQVCVDPGTLAEGTTPPW